MRKLKMVNGDQYKDWVEKYDRWYDDYKHAYKCELDAIRKLIPKTGVGLEVGVGTGRFAKPLNITYGVEPSKAMREFARAQGLEVIEGAAEDLPYEDKRFDFVLIVAVLHLMDDPPKAMQECFRVIKAGGTLVIGFFDRESHLGKKYSKKWTEDEHHKTPHFFTPEELIDLLTRTGFTNFQFYQTLFQDPEILESPDPITYGYGEGAFVVVRAVKI